MILRSVQMAVRAAVKHISNIIISYVLLIFHVTVILSCIIV
jgi:hypothetical protein